MSQRKHKELRSAWLELRRASLVRLSLGLVAAVVPLLLSSWWTTAPWHSVATPLLRSLFVGLAVFTLFWGSKRIDLPWGRRFWTFFAAAAACRFAAELFTGLARAAGGPGPGLTVEILYGAGYALLLIALDHRPHVMPRREPGVSDGTLSPLLLLLLVAGYMLYFPLLPLVSQSPIATGLVPSVPFHLILEALATVWLATLWHATVARRWKGIYGLLLASSTLSTAGLLLELASLRSHFEPAPLLTTLPPLLAASLWVLAAVLSRIPFTIQAETTSETEVPFEIPGHVGLRTLYLAIAFPCAHILLYSAGVLDESLRSSRELVVALCLPPLALVALQRHLALRRYGRQQLERRARLSSALQQSQANLRLLHQKQEAALGQRRAEERFSAFFRMSPTGLLIADLESGEVQEVNTNFERLLGLGQDELVGRPLHQLAIWAETDTADDLLARVRLGHLVHRRPIRLRTHRGWHEMLVSTAPLELGSGEGMMMVIRDVDDQRRSAEHLEERRLWRRLAEQGAEALARSS